MGAGRVSGVTGVPPDPARIARFLELDAPPAQAELAFVFGTRHPEPAGIAADLFHSGAVEQIVVTGGPNRATGACEAHAHLQLLLARGVPAERVIVEDRSDNTGDNVRLALPLIAGWRPLDMLHAIVAVCKWYHSRRAVMTLRRHLPAGVRYYAALYEPPTVCRTDWHLDPQAARRVLHEWDSIPRYLAQDDIVEVRRAGGAYL